MQRSNTCSKRHQSSLIRSCVWLAILLFAFSLPGAEAACQGQQTNASSAALSNARAELASGRPASAIRLLTPWLRGHPDDTRARLLLGVAYESAGDLAGAEAEFRLALKHAPTNPQALTLLGALYDHQRRPEKAEPLLAQAVRIAPHSAEARLAWAAVLAELHRYRDAAGAIQSVPPPKAAGEKISYLRLKASIALGNGEAGEAARDMESALAITPKSGNLRLATGIAESEAHNWSRAAKLLASIFSATDDPRSGLYLLEAEIESHANYSSTLEELRSQAQSTGDVAAFRDAIGNTLLKSGLNAEAAEDFKVAAAAAPGNPGPLLHLASAQLRAGQPDAAYASAVRALALQDNAQIESLLGAIQERRGQSLDAVHHDQRAVTLEPQEAQYWLDLGIELLRHETYKPALAVFKQAAVRFPQSLEIHVALGMTQYFLEQYPEAIRSLLAASRLNKNSPLAIDFLGQIQLQPQVTPAPGAVQAVCQFASAHSHNGDAMAYCGALLARAAHDRGDSTPPPQTLDQLSRAARLAPDNPEARCELGKTLEWAKQWRAAGEEMEACVRLDPGSAEGHYRLAEIYQREGKTALARQQIKLHDEAVKQMIASNARHDATLKKFLYSFRDSRQP